MNTIFIVRNLRDKVLSGNNKINSKPRAEGKQSLRYAKAQRDCNEVKINSKPRAEGKQSLRYAEAQRVCKEFKIVLLAWLYLLTAGCAGQQGKIGVKQNEIISIPAGEVLDVPAVRVSLDSLASLVRIIELEEEEDCLFDYMHEIVVRENSVYILGNQKCLQFDTSGKYIRHIGGRGNGPGEYIFADGLLVSGKNILLYDPVKCSLLCYDRIDGKYIKSIKLDPGVKYLTELYMLPGEETAVFTPDLGQEGRKRMLSFLTPEFVMSDSLLHPCLIEKQEVRLTYGLKEGQFITRDKKVKFKCLLSDTVFRLENRKLIPAYKFELGKLGAIREARAEENRNFSWNDPGSRWQMRKHMAVIQLLGETERFIFYSANDEPVYFYDKNEKTVHKWQLELPESYKTGKDIPGDDSQAGPAFIPRFIDSDGTLIGTVRNSKEDKNPYILMARLKK